jgi:hypothetical protein
MNSSYLLSPPFFFVSHSNLSNLVESLRCSGYLNPESDPYALLVKRNPVLFRWRLRPLYEKQHVKAIDHLPFNRSVQLAASVLPLSDYTITPATFQTSAGTLDGMTSDVFPGYYQHDNKTIRDNYYCR